MPLHAKAVYPGCGAFLGVPVTVWQENMTDTQRKMKRSGAEKNEASVTQTDMQKWGLKGRRGFSPMT